MNRVVVVASLTAAVVSAAMTLVIATWVVPHERGEAGVVRAARFEVVDQQGRVKAYLGGPPHNDSLTILDEHGVERMTLRLLADGTGILGLADASGRFRANFYVNAKGFGALQFFDEAGHVSQSVHSPQ